MRMTQHVFIGLTVFVLTVGTAQMLSSQEPATVPQEQKLASGQAEGELTRVDPTTQTFAIQTADGAEMVFTYNDKTEVTGAQEGIAGLAAKTGTWVIVDFTEEGEVYTATKIEVQGP